MKRFTVPVTLSILFSAMAALGQVTTQPERLLRPGGPPFFQVLQGSLSAESAAGSSSTIPVNLTPYQPPGWSGRIVVSTVTGTRTDSELFDGDSLFVDWAAINNGPGAIASSSLQNTLYLDGVLMATWGGGVLWGPGLYVHIDDFAIGSLAAGTHTLRLILDSTDVVAESDETDNEYTKWFTVHSSGSCTPSLANLCLASGRFHVSAIYSSPGGSGTALAVPLTGDTGWFWFFSSGNLEAVVKVLDARAINNRFWVFAGGLTNVAVTITVTDTVTGAARQYSNTQGVAFLPVQDTLAFVP